MITQVLADHPSSAKAHYVQAELYAREGKISPARSELATAEQLQPGLPHENPRSVQELKAQLGVGSGLMRPAMNPGVMRSVPAQRPISLGHGADPGRRGRHPVDGVSPAQ